MGAEFVIGPSFSQNTVLLCPVELELGVICRLFHLLPISAGSGSSTKRTAAGRMTATHTQQGHNSRALGAFVQSAMCKWLAATGWQQEAWHS